MSSPQFEKSDSGMQGLFTALDTQIENMDKAAKTVEGIRIDIQSHFMSNVAATPFLNKIEEWLTTYVQVKGAAGEILEKLVGSDHIIENTVSDAGAEAAGYSPVVDYTYSALVG